MSDGTLAADPWEPLPNWFWLIGAAAVAIGGFLAWRAIRFWLAPVVREAAIVASSEVRTTTQKGRVRHRYLVTIETPTGRHELETDRSTFAEAVDGTGVVAWRRDRFLLEVERATA